MFVTHEIDSDLKRLARDNAPARLALIERNVLDSVAGHRFAPPGTLFRMGIVTGCVALLMGVFGGVLPAAPDPSADTLLTPLLGTSRLTPSSLLVEGQ